uniref:Uncharacterized protein n=1 Tax=Siphoviridae sp. ctoNj20 TaxID=2826085 RepID=A0A8D9UHC1_9CAUD|nr:MAG TPA: hypothetical protein [Siphoviridae sp. ctoNj20]
MAGKRSKEERMSTIIGRAMVARGVVLKTCG